METHSKRYSRKDLIPKGKKKRKKEKKEKIDKDLALQSNLGRKLKENLDLFNMGMNQPGYIQSDSEEENSQTNEKYYQNFLDRLYNDGNHGNSKNKYQENKMYLHVNINNIISNSNNDNSKKFLEQNQNQIKLFNPSDLFPQENVVRGKRNSVTFKNLNPFINQTPKLFNVNRKKRNSCMIPLPLLEQLTGTDKIERGTSSNNLCIRTNKKE